VQSLASAILVGSALWLIAVGILMLVRPQLCLSVLSKTASTRRINNTEQGLRLLAGLALVVRAPFSDLPRVFEIGGWFIVVSSITLLFIPLRWHAGYAVWWANALPLWAVTPVAPLSVAAGLGLIAATFN
jgi:hypothetical protein